MDATRRAAWAGYPEDDVPEALYLEFGFCFNENDCMIFVYDPRCAMRITIIGLSTYCDESHGFLVIQKVAFASTTQSSAKHYYFKTYTHLNCDINISEELRPSPGF
jgi:hypothetical protein